LKRDSSISTILNPNSIPSCIPRGLMFLRDKYVPLKLVAYQTIHV
jgi:hypothetical protein